MKQVFAISGMSCSGCVEKVTESLSVMQGVSKAIVTLDPPLVSIEVDQPLSLGDVVIALPQGEKYNAHPKYFAYFLHLKRTVKKFLPLIIMFALVVAWTVITGIQNGFSLHYSMAQFMGAYFFFFGSLKVLNWAKFAPAYRAYDDLAKRSKIYAYLYPAIELGLSVPFVLGFWLIPANIITFVLMTQKAFSVHRKLKEGGEVKCACLGGFFSIPVTRVTFAEDLLMAIMAAAMLVHLL